MKIKIFSLAAISLAATLTALPAAQAATLNEKLMQCAVLRDSLERLVCFDALANTARTAPDEAYIAPAPRAAVTPVVPTTTPAQPQASAQQSTQQTTQQTAPQPVITTEEQFGKEHKNVNKEAPEKMRFTIAKLEKNPYGQHVITFTNGQKWKQLDDIHIRLSADADVIVSRGMFNAFYLKKPDANKSIKVKRID